MLTGGTDAIQHSALGFAYALSTSTALDVPNHNCNIDGKAYSMLEKALNASPCIKVCDWFLPRVSTFAFNFLQLGIVIHSALADAPLVQVGLLVLSFEVAILIDCFVRFGSTKFWGLALSVGIAIYCLTYWTAVHDFWFALRCLGIAICALSLKKIRSITEAVGGLKRHWRAYGYLAAGLFAPWLFLIAAAIVIASIVLSGNSGNEEKLLVAQSTNDLRNLDAYFCNMLHHWQYFSYAYLVPIALIKEFMTPPLFVGFIFYAGWIGYYLFIGVRHHQGWLLFAGHILASLAVIGMMSTSVESIYLICWFLTGVGGGTIILHRDLVIHRGREVYERSKTWESFGHVTGAICFASGLFSGVLYIPLLSAVGAGLSCALVCFVLARRDAWNS